MTRKRYFALLALLAAVPVLGGWIVNSNVSKSLAARCHTFVAVDNFMRQSTTYIAGRNGIVVSRMVPAGSTPFTVTGTTVRDPPYAARLRARFDECGNAACSASLGSSFTLVCDVALRGRDIFGRIRSETLTAVGEAVSGTLTDHPYASIDTVTPAGCTGFIGPNGRLSIWTSTVVQLPMPLPTTRITRNSATYLTAPFSVTRWDATNLDVYMDRVASQGVAMLGDYDVNAYDTSRHTINIDDTDVVTGNILNICMRGPLPESAPLGLE